MNTFHERLTFWMSKEDINASHLSESLKREDGSTPAPKAIYNYMTGHNSPSIEFLSLLDHYFPNLNINWLITGKGAMRYTESLSYNELIKVDDSTLNNKLAATDQVIKDLLKRVEELENK